MCVWSRMPLAIQVEGGDIGIGFRESILCSLKEEASFSSSLVCMIRPMEVTAGVGADAGFQLGFRVRKKGQRGTTSWIASARSKCINVESASAVIALGQTLSLTSGEALEIGKHFIKTV